MGLIDKLLGRSEEERKPKHECQTCGNTFDGSRVACPSCGGNVSPIDE